jgi:chemotaxis-related protein WspB
VTGVFRYHGQLVPALDLCQLHGDRPSRRAFGTRLVLVRYPRGSVATLLGLVAEDVTDVVEIDRAAFQPTGVVTGEAPWLGPMGPDPTGSLTQLIRVEDLLSEAARDLLFPDATDR